MRGFDVAQDPAGAGGGALLVVPDEQDPPAAGGDEPDRGVQVQGGGQPGLVDDDQAVGADPGHPSQPLIGGGAGQVVDQFVDGVRFHAGDRRGQLFGGGGLRRQTQDMSAGGHPRPRQHTHHGGLAGAGRRQCQLQHRRVGGDLGDHRGLGGVQHGAVVVGRPFQFGDLHIGGVDDPATESAGRREDPGFCVQDCRGRVELPFGDPEDRLAVGAGQRLRDIGIDFGVHPDRDAVFGSGGPDGHLVGQILHHGGVDPGRADLAAGFGVEVGFPPAGPATGHRFHRRGGQLRDQSLADLRRGCGLRGGGGVDHVGQFGFPTQDLHGLGVPVFALLTQGAGFVFGFPGGQGGLLGQLDHFGGGGNPAVLGQERCAQCGAGGGDRGPPGRPRLVEAFVDADELPDQSFPRFGGAVGEHRPDPLGDFHLELGVVELRGPDGDPVQHPAVQGLPLTVGVAALHLVGDGDVGVQIRVSGAGIAVGESGHHQAAGLHLPDAAFPGAGVTGFLLDPGDRLFHRRPVGVLDLLGHLGRRYRPQRGHRLDR